MFGKVGIGMVSMINVLVVVVWVSVWLRLVMVLNLLEWVLWVFFIDWL